MAQPAQPSDNGARAGQLFETVQVYSSRLGARLKELGNEVVSGAASAVGERVGAALWVALGGLVTTAINAIGRWLGLL